MATTPRKTFPELQALPAPVVDSDVLAVYRSPGPAKRTTATIFADYIKAFFSASGGSALVGFLQSGTGAVARTVQAKLRELPRSTVENATVAAAVTEARTNSHALFLPAGVSSISTGITFDFDAFGDDPFLWKGEGACTSTYAKGSTLQMTGTGSAALIFTRASPNTNIQNSPFVIEDIAVVGDSSDAAKSDGIAGDASGLYEFRNLLVADNGGFGLHLTRGYANVVRGGFIRNNWRDGIRFTEAANRIAVENVTLFSNGRNPAGLGANLRINCASNPAFGPVITNCDVSYSGRTLFSVSGGTLTNIVIAAGTATATAPAHGLTSGNIVSVVGGSVDLNNTAQAFYTVITVTGTDTFTWSTTAAPGTYNSADLRISTYGFGFYAAGVYGGLVSGLFCEEPAGWGAYYTSSNFSVLHHGGFMLQAWIGVEQASNVEVDGVHFRGSRAGLVVTELNNRATNNIGPSNTFVDGATLVKPTFYMLHGIRYGPSVPTTGTWAVGEFLRNSAPSASSPVVEWVCTVAGTPGTFSASKWLVTSGNTASRPTLTASDAGVEYLDTTLQANGLKITWNGSAWVGGIVKTVFAFDQTSIPAGGNVILQPGLTGAVLGDICECSIDVDQQGLIIQAYVRTADSVDITIYNPTAGPIDLPSCNWYISARPR